MSLSDFYQELVLKKEVSYRKPVEDGIISMYQLDKIRNNDYSVSKAALSKLALYFKVTMGDFMNAMKEDGKEPLDPVIEEEKVPAKESAVAKEKDAAPNISWILADPDVVKTTEKPKRKAKKSKPCQELTEEEKDLNGVDSFEELKQRQHPEGGLHLYNVQVSNPKPEDDKINHPKYYTSGDIECIDALKASMSRDEFRGFLKGNVQKYIWRYSQKNGVEDLEKARWYLDRLIGVENG